MIVMLPKRARVYSSDGKAIGRLSSINGDHFVSEKQGLIMDEEYRIPIQAVECVLPDKDVPTIEVGLSEEQLRHGHEIVEAKPNSDLIKGKVDTELKMPVSKQLIRYSAVEYFQSMRVKANKTIPVGYACDMCKAKFDNPSSLERHRSVAHKGPVGL